MELRSLHERALLEESLWGTQENQRGKRQKGVFQAQKCRFFNQTRLPAPEGAHPARPSMVTLLGPTPLFSESPLDQPWADFRVLDTQ